MSSSVFIESNVTLPKTQSDVMTSDSNLVVVYGKNGINFDQRGLENIIEEKSISTISVVRLTSPTPSMEDEEESERLEELERQLNEASDDSDGDTEDGDATCNEENKSDRDHVTGEDNESSQDENHEDNTDEEAPKVKKKPGRKPKIVKKQKKRRKPKERPEIVGLRVEQFYADDIANELVKNALKIAGLPMFKRTPATDALLEVIKNDHNYTPFTSPEQMRAQKAAERLEAERRAAQSRKLLPHTSSNVRQLASKKKLQLHQQQVVAKEKKPAIGDRLIPTKGNRLSKVSREDEDLIDDDDDKNSSFNADDDDQVDALDTTEEYDESELSNDSRLTDNDRESDIDFNVNNRNATKRKRKKSKRHQQTVKQQQPTVKQQQPTPVQKQQFSKRLKQQPEQNIESSVIATKTNPIISASSATIRQIKVSAPQIIKIVHINKSTQPTETPNKKMSTTPQSAPVTMTTPPKTSIGVRRVPIVKVAAPPSPINSSNISLSTRTQLLASPQDVKEIVINKNLNSPKGVFTNLNTLLNESNKTTIPFPTTPKSRNTATTTNITTHALPTQPSSKGFMPLGVDTATSNQLPAQISIQTHQSSSEIAAENERQLDLIDAIVQDELQKTSLIEQQHTTADENIPKLVKMLESTAEVLDQHNIPVQPVETTRQLSTFTSNLAVNGPNVNDIDIANAPLLETPDDDITADFLQHVVELIEDDKKFKEEVEKEVFGVPFNNEPSHNINHSIGESLEGNQLDINLHALAEKTEKSIVQAPITVQNSQSINSTESTTLPNRSDSDIIAPVNIQSDLTPTVRISNPPFADSPTEPVQIVRGNGRVITLPPIEAPTTRAKRRAQVTPATSGISTDLNSTLHTESSLDGSVYSNASYTGNESLSQLQLSAKRNAESSSKRQLQKEATVSTPTTPKGGRKRNVSAKVAPKARQIKTVDTEASESQEDDDDPKKLWCICRQPHNNRFMICCDICEDWFHGTCVNITKAMGREMELKGTDWTCPKCVQKQTEKKQPRITEMLQSKKNTTIQDAMTPQKQNEESNISTNDAEKSENMNLNQSSEQNSPPSGIQKKDLPTVSVHLKRFEISATSEKQALSLLQKAPSKVLHQQQLKFQKVDVPVDTPPCIVCKKPSRPNSIYCTDECIRKYAQIAIQTHQTTKTPEKANVVTTPVQEGKKGKKKDLFEDMLLLADSVSKGEKNKISVFERKTGRVISGHNAPSAVNLKKWLQENPTFEVVQPGSAQALEIEKRQAKRTAQTSSPTVNKMDISNFFKGTQRLDEQTESPPPMTLKVQKHTETINVPQATKTGSVATAEYQVIKSDKSDVSAESKPKNKVLKRNQSEHKTNNESTYTTHKTEPIRVNVRRTLKEQLLLRMKETQEAENVNNNEMSSPNPPPMTPILSITDVEQFAKNVESEMYNLFSKDTGAKYKAKYRSLMFNIKDRKNRTLFAKICAKEIPPKQLVRMTPEELASQELAMWRENENKHQLEIIKKSELDLLSCNKNYVLKTHKGEEVIEGKSTDFSNLDLNLPAVDDTIGENASTLEGNSDAEAKKIDTDSGSVSNKQPNKDKEKENSREKERDKKHKSHKDRDHHHHRSRGKSHSRKRSRSHSKSRSRSHEKRQKTSTHREDRHHSSHERHRDKEIKREKESGHQQDVKLRSSPEHNKDHQTVLLPQEDGRQMERIEQKPEQEAPKSSNSKHVNSRAAPAQNFVESCNLVDQILNSVKTVEEAAKLVKTKKEIDLHETERCVKEDPYMEYMKNVSTTPIWRGDLNMVDVSCFHVTMHSIVGNTQNIAKIFQERVEVVGRIYKETVWEYISKIKKSPTKEVMIVSLYPTNDKDVEGYQKLFEYLDSRHRLGVIGVGSAYIRDFYIYPFKNRTKIPPVLQTSEHVEFYDDAKRPDVLIGIIIRCISKRAPIVHHAHATQTISNAKAKLQRFPQKLRDTSSFTPPGSPKHRRISDSHSSKDDEIDIDAIIKAPIVSKARNSIITPAVTTKNDDDEPYSPGDSSDDEVTTLSTPVAGGDKDELKRRVEEINKQIAAQRKEIAGLLNVEPSDLDVPSTSSSVLSKISIPPNLSTILASIKEKTFTSGIVAELPAEEEYNPEDAIVSNSSYVRAKRGEKSTSSSRLAQLSEAELLSMVPDDIDDIPPIVKRSEEPPPPGV